MSSLVEPTVRPPLPARAVWSVVVLLVVIGVAAAVGRSVFPGDLTTRAEPVRRDLLERFHRNDPFASERAEELRKVDGRFAAHPGLVLLHVIPGGLFLLFAPLQFSRRIRTRHIRLHRWSGRALIVIGFLAILPAFYFGVFVPYAGPPEAAGIVLFGLLFVAALTRAFVAIRRRDVVRHREWMIRAFSIAIAISTVRLVALVVDFALTPAGWRPAPLFVLSIWTGWIVTVGGGELWIRRTR